MIVRDADLLAELSRVAVCTVCLSVPTVDEDAWRALEPGTAHPLQRLRAVRTLRDAGINAGVLMAPVVPGFTTQPSKLEATIKAVADHGAAFMGANVLYLKGGTKDHFMGFLPTLSRHGRQLRPAVRGAYASPDMSHRLGTDRHAPGTAPGQSAGAPSDAGESSTARANTPDNTSSNSPRYLWELEVAKCRWALNLTAASRRMPRATTRRRPSSRGDCGAD